MKTVNKTILLAISLLFLLFFSFFCFRKSFDINKIQKQNRANKSLSIQFQEMLQSVASYENFVGQNNNTLSISRVASQTNWDWKLASHSDYLLTAITYMNFWVAEHFVSINPIKDAFLIKSQRFYAIYSGIDPPLAING